MKKSQGFTLIELLVVVLIIGVLAALAFPQYQVAVEKARASEALINLKSLVSGVKLYRLSHGQYPGPNDWEILEIQMPKGKEEYYSPISGNIWKSGNWNYYLYYSGTSWARKGGTGAMYYISYNYSNDQYLCGVYNNNEYNDHLYTKVCAHFCGGTAFTVSSDRKTCQITSF